MEKSLCGILKYFIAAGTLLWAAAGGRCADSAFYNLSSSGDKAEMNLSGGMKIAASSATANTPTITLDGGSGSVAAAGTISAAGGFRRNGTDILADVVPVSRRITATAPLAGGGTLSGDIGFSLPAASEMSDGYLAAEDWNSFSSKLSYNSNGSGLSGIVKLSGANMTGQLTTSSTVTVKGSAFSVGGSTLVVLGGNVGIGTATPQAALDMASGGIRLGGETRTSWPAGETAGSLPVGTVINYVFSSCPSGYLALNGAAVSRTTFATLFALTGTIYGEGDGSTTFNLPDLRGYFVRGYDAGAGVDSGRTFGSKQADAFQGHRHASGYYGLFGLGGGGVGVTNAGGPASNFILDAITDGTNGTPRTATETRPKNIALQYCVKY